jgi:hypothetical protein
METLGLLTLVDCPNLANEFSVVMQFFSWDISQSGFSLKEKL